MPMGAATKKVPRSSGMEVKTLNKSRTYTSSNDENADVLLTARKHTALLTVAEEDLNDSAAAIIAAKERQWATSYGKYFHTQTPAPSSAQNPPTVHYPPAYSALTRTPPLPTYTPT